MSEDDCRICVNDLGHCCEHDGDCAEVHGEGGRKITVSKPVITYDTVLPRTTEGLHPPYQKFFERRYTFVSTPVNCSAAGHKTRFRTGASDGCDTCGVEW